MFMFLRWECVKNATAEEDLSQFCLDSFMPPSRRTGGSASNQSCKSCQIFVTNPSGSIAALNGGRHRGIEACATIGGLCEQSTLVGGITSSTWRTLSQHDSRRLNFVSTQPLESGRLQLDGCASVSRLCKTRREDRCQNNTQTHSERRNNSTSFSPRSSGTPF
jgi:hypothetical protein